MRSKKIPNWPLALAAAIVLLVPASSPAITGPAVIAITDRVLTKTRSGRSTIMQAQLLKDTGVIGNSATVCTYLGRDKTFGAGTSLCTVVYRLPKGPIIAEGLVARNALVFVLVVTGGAGYYTGVDGTVTSTAVMPRRSKLFFQLVGPG